MHSETTNPGHDVLLFASYCGGDNPDCSDLKPCAECLGMSNIFRLEAGGFRKWRALYDTAVPGSFDEIVAFGADFIAGNAKTWDGMRAGSGWRVPVPALEEVVGTIRAAFEPAMSAASRGAGYGA